VELEQPPKKAKVKALKALKDVIELPRIFEVSNSEAKDF